MAIRISAGLLHEYMAGRIDAERFKQQAFNDHRNVFDTELIRGNTIRNAEFEPAGIDEDDDYVVFEMDIDWDKVVKKEPTPASNAEADSAHR